MTEMRLEMTEIEHLLRSMKYDSTWWFIGCQTTQTCILGCNMLQKGIIAENDRNWTLITGDQKLLPAARSAAVKVEFLEFEEETKVVFL